MRWHHFRRAFPRLVAVFLTAGVFGHVAAADDVGPLLAELQNPALRQKGFSDLDAIPESSLAAVEKAAADPSLPAPTRAQITAHLAGIYVRLRAARQARIADAKKQWIATALDDAYHASPRVSPRFDGAAILALDHLGQDADGFALLQTAVDAGCNNSIVETLHTIRGLQLRRLETDPAAKQLDAAIKIFDDSNYPDGTKFFVRLQLIALMTSLNWPTDFKSQLKPEEQVSRTCALFGAYVAQKPDEESLSQAVETLWLAVRAVSPDAPAAETTLKGAIGAALGKSALINHIEALSLIDQGNQKRDPGGMESAQSLGMWDQARAVAKQGWEIDPLNSSCIDAIVDTLESRDVLPEVDLWTERALRANPDDVDVCTTKLACLETWSTDAACIAWGKECLEMGTPRNRLPVVLRNARLQLAQATDDPAANYRKPGVWADINAVYVKLLSDTSRALDDREQFLTDRGRYLGLAFDCGQWQAVLTLSQEFGDDIDMSVLGGKDMYAYDIRTAGENLAAAGKTPAAAAARIVIPPKPALPSAPVDSSAPATGRRGRRGRGGRGAASQPGVPGAKPDDLP